MQTPSVNLVVRFSCVVLVAAKVAQSCWPHSDLQGYLTRTFSYAPTLIYCKLQAKQNTTQTLYLCCLGKVLLVSSWLTDSDIFCYSSSGQFLQVFVEAGHVLESLQASCQIKLT